MTIRTAVRQILTGAAVLTMALLAVSALFVKPHRTNAASWYPGLPTTTGVTGDGIFIKYPATSTMDTQNVASPVTSQIYSTHSLSQTSKMVNIGFSVTTLPSSGSPSFTPAVYESDDGGISFYKVYAQDGTTFSAITSTGTVTGKDFPIHGDLIEIQYGSITAGSGANFVFTATAKQAQ